MTIFMQPNKNKNAPAAMMVLAIVLLSCHRAYSSGVGSWYGSPAKNNAYKKPAKITNPPMSSNRILKPRSDWRFTRRPSIVTI